MWLKDLMSHKIRSITEEGGNISLLKHINFLRPMGIVGLGFSM